MTDEEDHNLPRTWMFHLRINGGEERQFTVTTGVYDHAVAAIPALLNLWPPFFVEIWIPELIPKYGPYNYFVKQDDYGRLVISHVIRLADARAQA